MSVTKGGRQLGTAQEGVCGTRVKESHREERMEDPAAVRYGQKRSGGREEGGEKDKAH